MAVNFHFQKKVTLKNRRKLKDFILQIFIFEKHELELLDFIFCDDNYLLKINKDFLAHDYFTDIITFDLTQPNVSGITAEIYISVDMVRDNARNFKTTSENELNRVIFHGVLHLCGYKDKTKEEKINVRKKEDYYLLMFHGEH